LIGDRYPYKGNRIAFNEIRANKLNKSFSKTEIKVLLINYFTRP